MAAPAHATVAPLFFHREWCWLYRLAGKPKWGTKLCLKQVWGSRYFSKLAKSFLSCHSFGKQMHILLVVAAELSEVAAACHQSDMSASLQAQYQVSWRLARNKVEMGGKELHSYKSFRAFCEERDTAGIGKNHVHDNYEAKGSFWPHSSAKVSQKRRNVGYFLA